MGGKFKTYEAIKRIDSDQFCFYL